MSTLPAPIQYLPFSQEYADYRPVFSPDGRQVLYERTFVPDQSRGTHLWIYTLPEKDAPIEEAPRRFIEDPPAGVEQTRADWSRGGEQEVAFAGLEDRHSSIWMASGSGTDCQQLADTTGMIYPAWYPAGDAMAVMAIGESPGPRTKKIDRSGTVVAVLTDPSVVYAGMPSVDPADSATIAFAGQENQGKYNQKNNQIWLAGPGGPARQLDAEQGRAPWWSPDGRWIAFESGRGGDGYAIYIARADGSEIQQIPGTSPGGQHPKWSPDGRKLVCVLRPDPEWPDRIGIVDVSQYVGA